jgi:acetyl esterase
LNHDIGESRVNRGAALGDGNELDPEVGAVIEAMAAWDLPEDDLVAASRISAELEVQFAGPLVQVAEARTALLDTAAGAVPARVYRPDDARDGAVFLWIHGGGWICGTLDTCEPVARLLASSSRLTVVCPDYALSPEVAAPVAVEQCLATTAALRSGEVVGVGDVSVLAVGGDSAGANLAAGVTLLARDRGAPPIDLQVLCEPVLDPNWRSSSREAFATGSTITAEGIDQLWDLYLQGAAPSPYAAPLTAPDLAGLPPAIVVAAGRDPLRDEARSYAARLVEAGISVTFAEHPGLAHGMFTYFGVVAKARRAVEHTAAAVAEAVRSGDAGALSP